MMKTLLLRWLTYPQIEVARSYLAVCVYFSGLAHLMALLRRRGASILVYHSVNGNGVFWDNSTGIENFKAHVAYLARAKKVVPVQQIVDRIKLGLSVPTNWVAITFDDGYKDNIERAVPVLKDYEMPASFFCTTEVITGRQAFFYDEIQSAIDGFKGKALRVTLDSQEHNFSLSSETARSEAVMRLVLGIRDQRAELRSESVTRILESCEAAASGDVGPRVYMNKEDLRQLQNEGMEIGSHTQSHPNLAVLTPDELEHEISASKLFLERLIGVPVRGFAYPFGKSRNYNGNVMEHVRKAGYTYALTTIFGAVSRSADLFQLPRIGVGNFGLVRLKVRLLGLNV